MGAAKSILKHLLNKTAVTAEEGVLKLADKARELSSSTSSKAYEVLKSRQNVRLADEAKEANKAIRAKVITDEQVPRSIAPEATLAERARIEKGREMDAATAKYETQTESEIAARKYDKSAVAAASENTVVSGNIPVTSNKSKASKILERINTPEKAIELKGAERQEYLNALDEVHGPVESRAKDMGFEKDSQFHGSDVKDIENFLPSKRGILGPGVYVTEDAEKAQKYGRNLYEVKVKGDVKEGGKGQKGVHQRVITDPSNIRSANAAFDPRFKDSSKLLAGAAAMPVMGGGFSNPADVVKAGYHKFEQVRDGIANKIADLTDVMKDNPHVPQYAKDFYQKAAQSITSAATDPLNAVGGAGVADAALGVGAAAYDMYEGRNKPTTSYVDSKPLTNPTQVVNWNK